MNTIDKATLNQLSGVQLPDSKANPNKKLGQDAFMKLMLAQMLNQDPTAPMTNGQFITQMAQFETATGMQDLQKSFANLSSTLQSNQALQASALVGREVLAPGNTAALVSGGSISGQVNLPSDTTRLMVNIYDSSGQLVRNLPLGGQSSGIVQFRWDGLNDGGQAAPVGNYTVRIEAQLQGQSQALQPMLAAKVESVSLGSGIQDTQLNLVGHRAISLADVTKIQ